MINVKQDNFIRNLDERKDFAKECIKLIDDYLEIEHVFTNCIILEHPITKVILHLQYPMRCLDDVYNGFLGIEYNYTNDGVNVFIDFDLERSILEELNTMILDFLDTYNYEYFDTDIRTVTRTQPLP